MVERRASSVILLGLKIRSDEGKVQRVGDSNGKPDQERDCTVLSHLAAGEERAIAAHVEVLEVLSENVFHRKLLLGLIRNGVDLFAGR
jgi:hypothetical protein